MKDFQIGKRGSIAMKIEEDEAVSARSPGEVFYSD
jgi:hypothetical protein